MSVTHFDQLATVPTSFRSFEDAVARRLNEPRGTRPWFPSVDILQTANEPVLKADLPDVSLEDIEVSVGLPLHRAQLRDLCSQLHGAGLCGRRQGRRRVPERSPKS